MSLTGIAARRIVTCDRSRATEDDPLAVLEDGVVLFEGSSIRWIGPRSEAPDAPVVDYGDRVVTPGLVDSHTHSAWAGSRHEEYVLRMAGADYLAIAAAGGGIVSTQRAVIASSEDALASDLHARLARMANLGVTTVEVKSGYGLEPEGELKQLRAIARARADRSLPFVVATYLALHALPSRVKDAGSRVAEERASFVAHATTALLDTVASEQLASFVDAYVDAKAFTVDEARGLCERAKALGLGVRLHIGQFADIGGARLAADVGARSADHLEHVDDAGIDAMVKASVLATLLPVASFTLKQAPPPVARFREAGLGMVVASDANPGTAPTESLPLAMALAVPLYGLTPAEAILGATCNAALSLGLAGPGVAEPRGSVASGAKADFVVWDLPHEHAILQPWGVAKTHLVVRDGRPIAGSASRR